MSTVLLVKSLALVILHLCIMVISDFIYRFKQVTLLALSLAIVPLEAQSFTKTDKTFNSSYTFKKMILLFSAKMFITLEFYAAQPTSLYHTILNVFQEHPQVENFLKPMV